MYDNVDDILAHIDEELEMQAENGTSNDDFYWSFDEPAYVLYHEVLRLREDLAHADANKRIISELYDEVKDERNAARAIAESFDQEYGREDDPLPWEEK